MLFTDLFDESLVTRMREEGLVSARRHPELPLVLWNYTDRAQFRRRWNPVTLGCRGLVTHADTGQVLARPFGKFFNHGEPDAPLIGDGPVEAFDKVDGSLGILYPVPGSPGEYRITTRGHFASPQAVAATGMWESRYAHRFTPDPGLTYLFEILHPTSRIVIDYGVEDLVLLAVIEVETGTDVPVESVGWPGPVVERMPHRTLAEALAAEPRPDAEGLVVREMLTGVRVKIKQADYKLLHSVITGLRLVDVWTILAVEATRSMPVGDAAAKIGINRDRLETLRDSSDDLMADLAGKVPDELYPAVRSAADRLRGQVAAREVSLRSVLADLPLTGDRKTDSSLVFGWTGDKHDRGALMTLLSGGDIAANLWKQARPDPTELVLGGFTERAAADVA